MNTPKIFFLNNRGHCYFVMLVAAILLIFWNGGYVHTSIAWMLETMSIVEDGDLDLSNNWDCTPDSNGIIMCGCIKRHNGKAYSKYPVGRSLFLVPQYAAVHWALAAMPRSLLEKLHRHDPQGYWVLKNTAGFTNIFATVIASLFILLSVQLMGFRFGAGVFAGLAYVFCTSMFTYTASTLMEPVSAMWNSIGIYSWFRYRYRMRTSGAIVSYLAFALAFMASPQYILFLCFCCIFNLSERRFAIAGKGIAVAAVPVLIYCCHNLVRFGALFSTGYTNRELRDCLLAVAGVGVLSLTVVAIGRLAKKKPDYTQMAFVLSLVAAAFFVAREPWDLFGFTISPTMGMFIYSPMVLLALPGWRLLRRADKTVATELGVMICAFSAFLVAFTFEIDFILARFTSALLPMLCVLAAPAYVRYKHTRVPQALAALGSGMQLLVSVDNMNSYSFWGHLEKGLVIPAYPKMLFWHYSLLRYKLMRLHESLLQVPQFIHNPQAFDNTLFFNSYWFVVYCQELPLPLILSVMLFLAAVAVFCAIKLRRIVRHSDSKTVPV
jgi:hypothetical protein